MNLFNLYERLAKAFPLFDKISSRLLFSDSCIYEALFFKFLTVIDITSVNDDIACHHLLDDIPRRHAELAPVSHHIKHRTILIFRNCITFRLIGVGLTEVRSYISSNLSNDAKASFTR